MIKDYPLFLVMKLTCHLRHLNLILTTPLSWICFHLVIIHTVTQEFVESSEYKEPSEVEKQILGSNTILYDMVLGCLQDDPHNRPALEEICERFRKLNKSLKHASQFTERL